MDMDATEYSKRTENKSGNEAKSNFIHSHWMSYPNILTF